MENSLEVAIREECGKGAARRTRGQGKLPGVLYGSGKSVSITTEPKIIHELLLQKGGRNRVLTLKGTGVEGRSVMIKSYQVDPLSRALIHVDLLEIDLKKKIRVTVPLSFVGRAAGVADGGVMNIVERAISVNCLANQIPNHIDVDVTTLKIGDSIHLADLSLPAGMDKGPNLNPTLVTIVPPTKDEELAPSLAPSAEPEVITEKKAEGEEGSATAPVAESKEAKKEEKKK